MYALFKGEERVSEAHATRESVFRFAHWTADATDRVAAKPDELMPYVLKPGYSIREIADD